MPNKFVVKTTEEFTYDEQGRVVKKITTEESYEVEQASTSPVDLGEFVKKAVGVPHPFTSTWQTTNPYDSAKADTSGITHNITINANEAIGREELTKTVKKAIENHMNY